MITAVDTNILIVESDPIYGPASKEALKKCLKGGTIVACEVVWAEVAGGRAGERAAIFLRKGYFAKNGLRKVCDLGIKLLDKLVDGVSVGG